MEKMIRNVVLVEVGWQGERRNHGGRVALLGHPALERGRVEKTGKPMLRPGLTDTPRTLVKLFPNERSLSWPLKAKGDECCRFPTLSLDVSGEGLPPL